MPEPTPVPQPATAVTQASREERLTQALDELMHDDPDIQAAALVSLDGFTMASALPQGMQADRVGAMSAAILGLGERAATELGRGHLSQVFIEGENGYVLLIAAGSRAVLTALADPESKLGLVLYDMKTAAERIGAILG
ncbi:MAG: roadblock/LC7 domain-containing protein [Coriobacteriia bacterium]|nr:roadblock/LC7 domain-containing protein [Coriobacteriia bacterium]